MDELVEFQLEGGHTVVVEVAMDEEERGLARASLKPKQIVFESGKRFEEAIDAVRPAAEALVNKLRGLAPGEIGVEFGLKLTFKTGAVIASSAAEGHFKVNLKWQRDD